ncbi:glycosyltransferase family 4 protein [Planctomycetota bacterium]|nr:glycosyltransferase family 4 protein [Planctomycetota bacterium]
MQQASEVEPVGIRVAYGSVPKEGGTFTFYRNHRDELQTRGIHVRCVAVGTESNGLWNPSYADEGCVRLAPRTWSLRRQVEAFVKWCEAEKIDVVIPVNSRPILASIPHLPARVRVISRCANALHDEYLFAATGLERVSTVVALTPRLGRDLAADYAVDPGLIQLIPNGVDTERFDAPPRRPTSQRRIELGFLGRLEHRQKGVLFLPPILQALEGSGVDFHLSIGGQGVDEGELRRELAPWVQSGQVSFLGLLDREVIPGYLASCDVFLFPSQFEGCPNALLEAMAAGCVPICWVIEGITDFIVEDRVTGFLHPLGDAAGMASSIAEIARGEVEIESMSARAQEQARARFSLAECARQYGAVMAAALSARPLVDAGLPISRFDPPAWLLRRLPWIPEGLRRGISLLRRRLRRTT